MTQPRVVKKGPGILTIYLTQHQLDNIATDRPVTIYGLEKIGISELIIKQEAPKLVYKQEKLYKIEIPDPEKPNGKKTNLAKFNGKVFLSSTMGAAPLTETEIKRNHAWAWPFAREVE